VLVNSNFNTGAAVFGLGLAVWAKRNGRHPLIGLGAALCLWRPANCLPALAVLLASGWQRRELLESVAAAALFLVPLIALAFLVEPDWVALNRAILAAYVGWAGVGPHLIQAAGPLAYAGAQAAVAVAGMLVMRRRSLAEGAAFAFALSVFLATVGGAYSGAMALPALVLAAQNPRYVPLPAIAGFIGWMLTFAALATNFPVGVVAYWFVVQAYPLVRRPTRRVMEAPTVGTAQTIPSSQRASSDMRSGVHTGS
jgi:uncharacterized membrane protein